MTQLHRCAVVKVLLLLIVVVLDLPMKCVYATNYCSRSLCFSAKHIGCDHNGAFDLSCPRDAELVDFTTAHKKTILNAHNELRNRVAGGHERSLQKACRMPTMQWDNELAYLAELNVKQCRMNHDACRKTDNFHWAGQNLAWISYHYQLNVTQKLQEVVELWSSEVAHTNMGHIHEYPHYYYGPPIGHFTVMVADKNTHLGCGATTYSDPYGRFKVFLLACNYATTNIIGLPIYKSCYSAGEKCTKGTDDVFNNLCKKSEPIDPNDV